MSEGESIQLHFRLERETKGAVRFEELDAARGAPVPRDKQVVGKLYVRKAAFATDDKIPYYLKVTLEMVE